MPIEIQENREAVLINGQAVFQITNVCVAQGNLPSTRIFIYALNHPSINLKDTFERVATIADLTQIRDNRDAALTENASYYRSAVAVLRFTDVKTANQAADTLRDRINQLSRDYAVYEGEFKTSNTTVEYPTADQSLVDTAKTNYTNARNAYDAAQVSLQTSEAALTSSENSYDTADDSYSDWEDVSASACNAKNKIGALQAEFNDLLDSTAITPNNAHAFINQVEEFLNAFDAVHTWSGNSYYKIALTGSNPSFYVDANDVGRYIMDNGAVPRGILLAYKKDPATAAYTLWIHLMVTPFNPGDQLATASRQSTYATVDSATNDDAAHAVLQAEATELHTKLNDFQTTVETADAHKNDYDTTYTNMTETCSTASTAADESEQIVNDAEKSVRANKQAVLEAKGALSAAYTQLLSAYDNVKDICPNWSPDTPLPPKP